MQGIRPAGQLGSPHPGLGSGVRLLEGAGDQEAGCPQSAAHLSAVPSGQVCRPCGDGTPHSRPPTH